MSRKIIFPAFAAAAILSYAIPTFAYSSVTAEASITFTNRTHYYVAIGKGRVAASGSKKAYQRIENFTIFQNDASWVDDGSDTDDTSPVTVTISSGEQGDPATWTCSVIGELWEGSMIDSDENTVKRKHNGI